MKRFSPASEQTCAHLVEDKDARSTVRQAAAKARTDASRKEHAAHRGTRVPLQQ